MRKIIYIIICLFLPIKAMATPDLAAISAGSAFVSQNPAQTIIQQTTDKAVLNWNNFDIASDHQVIFQQPHAGAFTLNRVSSILFPTYIDGRITANGSIAIVNPQGIFIGPSGVVQSSGFIASTHDILDSDVMDSDNILNFNIAPFYASPISHQGIIEVGTNGKIVLNAPYISLNGGQIRGEGATVNITTADTISFDLSGGSDYLQLVLSSGDIYIQNSSIINAGEGDINILSGNQLSVNDTLVQSSGGDIHFESVYGDIFMNANTIATSGFSSNAGNVAIDTYAAAPFFLGSSENFIQLAQNDISGSSKGGDIIIRSAKIFGDNNCIKSGNVNCTYKGQNLIFKKDKQQIKFERAAQKSRNNIEEKVVTHSANNTQNQHIESQSYLDIQIDDESAIEE